MMKPCPFCDSADQTFSKIELQGVVCVVCIECGARGPVVADLDEAIKSWCTRDGSMRPVEPEDG